MRPPFCLHLFAASCSIKRRLYSCACQCLFQKVSVRAIDCTVVKKQTSESKVWVVVKNRVGVSGNLSRVRRNGLHQVVRLWRQCQVSQRRLGKRIRSVSHSHLIEMSLFLKESLFSTYVCILCPVLCTIVHTVYLWLLWHLTSHIDMVKLFELRII